MATDEAISHQDLTWQRSMREIGRSRLQAVAVAEARIRGSIVGTTKRRRLVPTASCAREPHKMGNRRAVANVAAPCPSCNLREGLSEARLDDNGRVRQAAPKCAPSSARCHRHASSLGKQHEDRINSILDDIEARFGPRGPECCERRCEQIAKYFCSELYTRLSSSCPPLAVAADRLAQLTASGAQAGST